MKLIIYLLLEDMKRVCLWRRKKPLPRHFWAAKWAENAYTSAPIFANVFYKYAECLAKKMMAEIERDSVCLFYYSSDMTGYRFL